MGRGAMQIEPIARVRSPYPTKFGVPRQPGLVDLPAEVVFEPAYRSADAVRGLEGFDYVWLIWAFSHNVRRASGASAPGRAPGPDGAPCPAAAPDPAGASDPDGASDPAAAPDPAGAPNQAGEPDPAGFPHPGKSFGWSPTVRPPILGGTRRMGVFATRSSFRPNDLALSCVRLLAVEADGPEGPVLRVGGADMADGTPVFDVKPYLPYADAHPTARAGWTEDVSWPVIDRVDVPPAELAKLPADLRVPFVQVLRQDPRPAYARRGQEGRTFWVPLGRWAAWFRVGKDPDGESHLVVTRVAELSEGQLTELRETGTVAAFEEGR